MSLAVNSTIATTIQGVVYKGQPYNVDIAKLPMPSMIADTDAIVQIKIAGICGTDMHMYHGFRGTGAEWGLGHEALGYVSEIGSGVSSLAVGDYVVIPDNVDSGHLDMEAPVLGVFGVGRGLEGLQGEEDDHFPGPHTLTRNSGVRTRAVC
jgi:NADPH:quinone reductase-like Zn-dependent oxidoreductase